MDGGAFARVLQDMLSPILKELEPTATKTLALVYFWNPNDHQFVPIIS